MRVRVGVFFLGRSAVVGCYFRPQDLFWIEAAKNEVLPLDNSKAARFDVSLTRGRSVFTYFDGMTRIPEGTAPDLKNKSFKIGADVGIAAAGANGVIATQGGRFNGWGLYLLDGKPVFHYNLVGASNDLPSPAMRHWPRATTSSWWTSSMTAAASAKAVP